MKSYYFSLLFTGLLSGEAYTDEQPNAYRSVRSALHKQVADVKRQTEEFADTDDPQEVSDNIGKALGMRYWPEVPNALANEQLHGAWSELAAALRSFSIRHFNEFQEAKDPIHFLNMAYALQPDAQVKDRIQKDLCDIRVIAQQNLEQAKAEAESGKLYDILEQLLAYKKQVDTSGKAMLSVIQPIKKSCTILLKQLKTSNHSQDKDTVEARDALAATLRNLAVGIWNRSQSTGSAALFILKCARQINAYPETQATILADQKTLQRLVRKKTLDSIPSIVWLFAIGIIITVVVNLCSDPNTKTSSTPVASSSSSDSSSIANALVTAPEARSRDSVNSAAIYEPDVSEYEGNQLSNGASPLDNCFGKGKYAGPCWIDFRNDNSDTDAIVCLARTRDNKVVRNEYIRAGSSFRMSHIPTGRYYLKVFYGSDWNPTRRSACGTKGYFDSDQHFSASRAPDDLIEIRNNGRTYTAGTMTLYKVAGGNMAQQNVGASEFFQQ